MLDYMVQSCNMYYIVYHRYNVVRYFKIYSIINPTFYFKCFTRPCFKVTRRTVFILTIFIIVIRIDHMNVLLNRIWWQGDREQKWSFVRGLQCESQMFTRKSINSSLLSLLVQVQGVTHTGLKLIWSTMIVNKRE